MENHLISTRPLALGDVLFRYLPEYQVWHTGIIVEVHSQDWYNISVMEFDDSNTISINNLRQYLWGRKYFWVSRFINEKIKYGPEIFRSIDDRLKTAWELYEQNNLTYLMHKYNCEYFTRRCVFKDEEHWPSTQTTTLSNNRKLFYLKMISVFVFGFLHNIHINQNFERSMRDNDFKYTCVDGKVVFLGMNGKSNIG